MDKQNIGTILDEMKSFISEDEMKKFKSNAIHKKYYIEAFDKIGSKNDYIRISRIRMKPTRYFYEEFETLMNYVDIKYKDDNSILWRWCGNEIPEDSLRYDGVIKKNNKIIEKVEVVCPLHSNEDIIAGKSLNEKGIYCYPVVYVEDYENECKKKLVNEVTKKNNKGTYDETITLVVLFDEYKYLPTSKLSNKEFVASMFKDLKQINYVFKNVYILMGGYNGSDLKYAPYLIQIK